MVLAAVVAAAMVSPAFAQLAELETDDLRLLYIEATQGYLAPHVARCFENSMAFQRELWDYEPSEPVTVILSDLSDRGNASAGTVPRNMLALEMAPLSFVYEIVSANERMNWLLNHELVHIVAADQAARRDRSYRQLFQGKVAPTEEQPETILYNYLTSPRDASPRWYHEGIAVFIETWMAGGMGRAQGAWDETVFRSMVRDSSHFYDPLGLVSEGTKIDFQVEVNSYLYGTRFMSYLALQYGPESLLRWVARKDGSRAYYASQFEQVYGRAISELWHEWVEWEREFQQHNLEAIRQYPTTPYRDLSEQALGSVSRAFYDPERRKLYAAFNYPGVVAHIGSISTDDGAVEKIIDIKGPVIYSVTSLTYDPDSSTIYYTTDNLSYRDLRAVDPVTGRSWTLIKDARVGDLAFNRADGSIWGIRHFNGIATLVRIPRPYAEWHQVRSWPYGETTYDLDVSPDGRLLSASIGEINGRQSLRVFRTDNLLSGGAEAIAEVDFGTSMPLNFVFGPDGRFLYGSSYSTGVSNLFRYDWQQDSLEALSNTETGLFRPVPLDDGSLIAFRYTGAGLVATALEVEPVENVAAITFLGNEIVKQHPVVKEWVAGSPADVPLDEMITGQGEYHGFKSVNLESIYPVVQGYKDSAAVGLRLNLSDPILFNRLNLTASYSPDGSLPSDERTHLELNYDRYDWRVALNYNHADFYDLFGPTKRSLKGYSAEVGWDHILIWDEPRRMDLRIDAAFYGDLDQVPGNQNVASPYTELLWAQASVEYDDLRSSLGHVDDEKGIAWRLAAANDYVNGESIPSLHGELDLGFALPLRHSSIWLRSSAGFAVGDKENPFANFYFGGFGNNWVDHLAEQRYREFARFPGLEIDEIGGGTYAKTMLEWNLPPLRFESVGWPGFYLTWARTALFASGLATDLDNGGSRREVANVGAQIDLRFMVLSRMPMTVSLGYATAFEQGFAPRDEVMFSLKIL
ncbi:MAG: hypothetical protein C3F15_11435 [Holophagae bacterium]|nr:MAG: hypothetical protein C3F15_11435 [Holophagae bacterium]